VRASIVELEAFRDGSFDHAACLFSWFNLHDPAGRRWLLADLWRS
jgi:hypothetical protein